MDFERANTIEMLKQEIDDIHDNPNFKEGRDSIHGSCDEKECSSEEGEADKAFDSDSDDLPPQP